MYFINLTIDGEVIWIVLPLVIATFSMIIYFQRYQEEWPGWNTLVANSLVLLFVGMSLLKYLWGINDAGAINFIEYYWKFIWSIFIIFIGVIMTSLNFNHYLTKEMSAWISSPITINLVAYAVTLIVYSNKTYNFTIILSLLIWFFFLASFFQIIKTLINRFFVRLKKLKEKEEIEDIREEKRIISKKKVEVKKEEKNFKKQRLKKVNDKKKQALKLKKELK